MFLFTAFTALALCLTAVSAVSASQSHRVRGVPHGSDSGIVARHVGFAHDVSVRSPNVTVKSAPVRRALRRRGSGQCKASASSAAASSSAAPATSASSSLLSLAASVSLEVPSSSAYIAPTSSSSSYQVPSTSSAYVPVTTSSSYYTPGTSSTYYTPATSSTADLVVSISNDVASSSSQDAWTSTSYAAPATTTSSSTGSTYGTYSGHGTWYYAGLGACGWTNSGTDYIAAISSSFFDDFDGYDDADSNDNPICGKLATVTYGSAMTTVTIVDSCPTCDTGYDLDMSLAAFSALADSSVGEIDITWTLSD
ncbi:hypothetical protein FISHEDRAFT_59907 [Fistulina hepatica ATCC 64428]|uniref:Uncharacterized protein n=1 Tax=Fistulina hepatica ATCC 64428 TaxID=1128425 RepID=A0A0D7A7M0_9AGAR|nr:hypothetical protein FISHEDRAFT_59907 [Fistulina hepatica ATCC 64428]